MCNADGIEYSDDSECPKCRWDADGADESHLIDICNSKHPSDPELQCFFFVTLDWKEVWKCPECGTLFKVEGSNY